jgi:CBS domain containing-hemolysin-like protein
VQSPQLAADWVSYGWRLAATLGFLLLNGFFVAAEFALVKVRPSQLVALAEKGGARATAAQHISAHFDHYLSACQLGITISSLVLGWLAEPAVAQLLIALAALLGWTLLPASPFVHGVALALALTVITLLHMIVGEQAPKIWAINRAEGTAQWVAQPLRWFALLFAPFIWVVNAGSNALLRLLGMSAQELKDSASVTAEELKSLLASSAEGGHISRRQVELAANILDIVELEVRHVLVPRVDVAYLSLQNTQEENLEVVQRSGHSRFPLCRVGLDTVIGVVHAKDVLRILAEGGKPDLVRLARKPVFVSDRQSLSRLIFQLQRAQTHCAVVIDEHGSAVGLAFLEDALEEIVGPIRDEFDEAPAGVERLASGVIEMPGSLSLPEARDELELEEIEEDADTIGGYVVAQLGRLPRKGDELRLGRYRAIVTQVAKRAVSRLRLEPQEPEQE